MYKTIYIERYNNNERMFKKEHILIDTFAFEEAFGEAFTDEFKTKAFERLKIADGDMTCDINYININMDNIDFDLYCLRKELLEQSVTVSGDDDVFDYFPDLVFAFYQICKALDKFDYFKTVETDLNRILNYKQEDEEYICYEE